MTSKERMIAAITLNSPDRIPLDIWPVPASFKRYGADLEALFEKHPMDFVHPNWRTPWAFAASLAAPPVGAPPLPSDQPARHPHAILS